MAVEFTEKVCVTAANLPILLAMMFFDPVFAVVVSATAGLWGLLEAEFAGELRCSTCRRIVLPAAAGAFAFRTRGSDCWVSLATL